MIQEAWRNGTPQNILAEQFQVKPRTIWDHTKEIEPEKCNFGHPRTPENRYTVTRTNRSTNEHRCKQCQHEAYLRQKNKKKVETLGVA